MRHTAILVAFALSLGAPLAAAAGAGGSGRPLPGAYCPIPEPGQPAACIDVARETYPGFIEGVEQGELDPEATRALEADLDSVDRVYLALSSLAYGYYRLAEHSDGEADPSPAAEILERWNHLLSQLYEASHDRPELQHAVRTAAEDLDRKAQSDSSDVLLRTLRQADAEAEQHGIRAALSRIVQRMRGGEGSLE